MSHLAEHALALLSCGAAMVLASEKCLSVVLALSRCRDVHVTEGALNCISARRAHLRHTQFNRKRRLYAPF